MKGIRIVCRITTLYFDFSHAINSAGLCNPISHEAYNQFCQNFACQNQYSFIVLRFSPF